MKEPIIAIFFEFDETLGPESTSFLLEQYSILPSTFWNKINKMVEHGWDPPLAYMHELLILSQKGKVDLSTRAISRLGKHIRLFFKVTRVIHCSNLHQLG